jgi:DNA-binding CsgD family transcriptional regulator
MNDEKLTKLTGSVIAAVSAQVRHLVDAGLVEPDKLRLTIEARGAKAKQLTEDGMSQRKAAEALGVDEKTVRNDLRNLSAEGADIIRTSDRDEPREAAIVANEAFAMTGMSCFLVMPVYARARRP